MSFSADLAKIAKKTGLAIQDVRKGITVELFSSVIRDTPVDSGRARGNWQATQGAPAAGQLDRLKVAGADAEMITEIEASVPMDDQASYLTNNLPYIGRLEYEGYSRQAPDGMVRKNAARIDDIVRKQVNEHKV